MTYMALLGTEVGLRDGTQVAVTAVVDKLHLSLIHIYCLKDFVEQLKTRQVRPAVWNGCLLYTSRCV